MKLNYNDNVVLPPRLLLLLLSLLLVHSRPEVTAAQTATSLPGRSHKTTVAARLLHHSTQDHHGLRDSRELNEADYSSDQRALLSFKQGITRDPTKYLQGWNASVNKNHCHWNGVTCHALTKRVTGLDLTGEGYPYPDFEGIISPELGLLTSLQTLYLEFSKLSGTIPVELGQLALLLELCLNDNLLTGEIPMELTNCRNLTIFSAWNNNLNGSLHPAFGMLRNLKELSLGNNTLTGTIPTTLGSLTKLQFLDLGRNDLEGTISSSLGNCSSLQDLWLDSNPRLTGSIPPALGNLQELVKLTISASKVQGSIPYSLGNCGALQHLDLQNNSLSGTIPDSLGNCEALEYLDLQNNSLSGTIPASLGRLHGPQLLILSNNDLEGPIPDTLGQCLGIQTLALGWNRLTGTVPRTLSNCTAMESLILGNNELGGEFRVNLNGMYLQVLSLRNNSFTGRFRSDISDSMLYVDLSWNEFSGELPAMSLTPQTSLAVVMLMLGHNKFEGQIPPWIWNLPSLQVLDLSNNNLLGPFSGNFSNLRGFFDNHPTESKSFNGGLAPDGIIVTIGGVVRVYTVLTYVTSMDLSMNQLFGVIPPNIVQLRDMVYFNLSYNAFTGTIPSKIGSMRLQFLDMSNNFLDGEIPPSLGLDTQLGLLQLANNNLTGQIPTATQLQSQNPDAYLPGNPGLCGSPLDRICNTSKNGTTPKGSSSMKTTTTDDILSILAILLGIMIGFIFVSIAICVFWKQVMPMKHVEHYDEGKNPMKLWRPMQYV